jgi:acetyltransferase
LLAAYGFPTVETRIASDEAGAVAAAEAIGYPAVLKLYSKTITHKTDVGGVRLDLADAEAVRAAYRAIEESAREHAGEAAFDGVTVQPMVRLDGYELIIGSSLDPQFGPVLLFGAGGQLVEVFRDSALGLPPLNTTLARRMMERTKIFTALGGVRGRAPVDLAALAGLLVRFGQLIVEQPLIRELDINPLLASPEGLLALDARIVIHGAEIADADLPRPVIHPYPSQYVSEATLKDGTPVVIRPIRPEDEPLLIQFHQTLSERSVYFRYFHMMTLHQRTSHERLTRMCFIDYAREMALVVERTDPEGGGRRSWPSVASAAPPAPPSRRPSSPSWSMTVTSGRGSAPSCWADWCRSGAMRGCIGSPPRSCPRIGGCRSSPRNTVSVPSSISVETILSSALSTHLNFKQVISPMDIALHAS